MTDELFFEDSEETEDSDESDPEPNPGIIARLDQEEAAFASERKKWIAQYGFDHDCQCGQDYASGNVTEVTYCFMRLTNQALQRAAQATFEINTLGSMLTKMIEINNDLVGMLEDLGHTDELQKYFSTDIDESVQEEVETIDLESEFEQLILLGEDDEGDDEDNLVSA